MARPSDGGDGMKRHKDHLTATCPYFQSRTDYRGGHWVVCCLGHKGFRTAWERNQYYEKMCCRRVAPCELREIGKVEKEEGTQV